MKTRSDSDRPKLTQYEEDAARFASRIGLLIFCVLIAIWLIPGGGAAAIADRMGIEPSPDTPTQQAATPAIG